MIKVMFVCLGNICRSPMAEFMFSDMLKKRGITNVSCASAATSDEAEGCGVHRGTREKMREVGVPVWERRAVQLTPLDYAKYDYFLGMDEANVRSMKRLFGGDLENKVFRLLDFSPSPRDIADPWYTGNFDRSYEDIKYGLECFCDKITK